MPPVVARARDRLVEHVSTVRGSSLHLNTYALVLNQVGSAGFGVLYWMIAARLYSVDVVGRNSAIISTLMLLGSLGSLGLKSAMVRFVPRSGPRTTQLVLRTYGLNVVATVLISALFLETARRLQFLDSLSGESDVGGTWLILATVIWCIFSVQDGVLTGLRQSVWVLAENQLFNLVKIALLFPAVWFAYDIGIAVSWFLPTVVLVLFVNALIFARLIPRHIADPGVQVAPVGAREAMPSVTGDYIGSLLAETGVRILPLLVVSLLGASAGAYFYQAWTVSIPLTYVAQSMTSPFTAEAAADRSRLRTYSLSILRHMAYLVVPGSIAIAVAAPLVLKLFGPAYAAEGTTLLRYLVLAAPPAILIAWYLAYSRVKADTLSIALSQSVPPLLTLGLSYWWLPAHGVASIGVAWLISNVLVAAWIAAKTLPFLLGHANEDRGSSQLGPNRTWRRADWRFLLPNPRPQRSAVFSRGTLARSVATVSDESVEGAQASSDECDLAVASDPTRADLLAAHRALRAGGACYTEWAPWRVGGTWGIRRRLRAAGFSDVRLYWAYPSPAHARFWLPLPAECATCRYLSSHLGLGKSRLARLAEDLVCVALRAALRFGLVPSLSAIGYKGKDGQLDLFEKLSENYSRLHSEVTGALLSFLVLTGGYHLDSNVVCLVFAGPDPTPQWVAKLPRIPAATAPLHNEAEILRKLSPADSRNLSLDIPRVVGRFGLGDVPVHVQTALAGVPFMSRLTWDSYDKMAARLTDHQLSPWENSRAAGSETDFLSYANELLEKLEDSNGPLLDSQMLSQVRAAVAGVGVVRRTLAHNDFTPWNLLWTEEGLGAIDWGDASWDALPLMDLVYGLASTAFLLDESWGTTRMLATYRKLLDPREPAGAIFQRETTRYAREVGLHEDQVAPIRLLTWVLHGRYELDKFRLEYGNDAGRRWLHESVCIPLWRLELGMRSETQDVMTVLRGVISA